MTAQEFLNKHNIYETVTIGYPTSHIVSVNEDGILYVMQEYARIKCLEAIRNTRYKAIDIIQDEAYHTGEVDYPEANVEDSIKRIQNIPNQDVMPEL